MASEVPPKDFNLRNYEISLNSLRDFSLTAERGQTGVEGRKEVLQEAKQEMMVVEVVEMEKMG